MTGAVHTAPPAIRGVGAILGALCALLAGAALAQTPPPASAPAAPAPAVAAPAATTCPETESPAAVAAYAGRHPQSEAAPVTGILPSGDHDSARFLFHQAQTQGAAGRRFVLFEATVSALDAISPIRSFIDPKSPAKALPILAVRPAQDNPPADLKGFTAADSVELKTEIQGDANAFWPTRYFLIASCSAGDLDGWGLAAARVSDPTTTLLICLGVALVTYGLGILAIMALRGEQHVLNAKYPAIFGDHQMTLGSLFNPIYLAVNAFNQASVQKLQVLVFSFLVGSLLLLHVLRTGALVGLSATVVGLLGISGVGAAAAQITYREKTRLSFENWAWLQHKGVLKVPDPASSPGPRWRDLVMTSREFDVYKLQTIIFSIGVAVEILVAGSSQLQTFSVPPEVLGVLGLSQVVYVGGVLVKPPAESDLDDALTKLRLAGETVAAAKTQKTDTDKDGKLLSGTVADDKVALNAQRQYDDQADLIIPMIETTLEVHADRTKL
jgi:hypothetical protein